MSFGGGSCIISPAGCIGELLMPFNGCPYSVTWDQCPSGKETRNGWCILEVTCQRAETRRDQQTWEWDVSAGRGNLFGFGLLSPYSAFKNESRWLSLTHNDMARRGHWGKKPHILFTVERNWVHTRPYRMASRLHGGGRGDLLCISYVKLFLQTKLQSAGPDNGKMWIELNRAEVGNNGKWSFFFVLPSTIIIPDSLPLSSKRE